MPKCNLCGRVHDKDVENEYIVALLTGGTMEQPEFQCENFQVIKAKNEKEAQTKYNNKNKCSYYYGYCICMLSKDTEWLVGHLPIDKDVLDRIIKEK